MSTVYASTIIDAPLAKVWAHLRNFGAIATYSPGVAKLSFQGVESGDQLGSVRTVWRPDGSQLRERLLALSDVDHSATYSVEIDNAPFENCVATVALRPVTDRDATFIEWSTAFDVTDRAAASGLRDHIANDIFGGCFRGLRALVAAQ